MVIIWIQGKYNLFLTIATIRSYFIVRCCLYSYFSGMKKRKDLLFKFLVKVVRRHILHIPYLPQFYVIRRSCIYIGNQEVAFTISFLEMIDRKLSYHEITVLIPVSI